MAYFATKALHILLLKGGLHTYHTEIITHHKSTIMFAHSSPVLPSGSTILVTGVSGFVGSHVADQLLASGYRVRGTTRNSVKNAWLSTTFGDKYADGLFELIAIPDIAVPGAFGNALRGTVPKASNLLTGLLRAFNNNHSIRCFGRDSCRLRYDFWI